MTYLADKERIADAEINHRQALIASWRRTWRRLDNLLAPQRGVQSTLEIDVGPPGLVNKKALLRATLHLGAPELVSFAGFGFALDYDRLRYHLRLDRFGLKMAIGLVENIDPKLAFSAAGTTGAKVTELARTVTTPAASTIDSSLRGDLSLGATRPFALAATFDSQAATRYDQPDIRSKSAFSLNGSLEQLAAGVPTATVDVGVHGTTAAHAILLSMTQTGQRWQLGATGGLANLLAAPQWRGQIDRVDAAGRWNAKLAGAAEFEASAQRVQLDHFSLDADTATIRIARFRRDAAGVTTSGHLERVQVAPLLRFATPTPAFTSDLQLRADWNLQVTDRVAGSFDIQRERGDVVMQGATPMAFGLRTLHAHATATTGGVRRRCKPPGLSSGSWIWRP